MSSVLPLKPHGPAAPPVWQGSAANEKPGSQARHRADIDGLRGIAVLSVLAVHCFPHWVHGGFIGVDIFFVLSGFLITGLLLQALEERRFSFADFYARRARRLLPALCLVLLACLVFSVVFTFPSISRQVGAHVAAGATFTSNFVLWKESGYFDASSEAKPLLHLWSLGIEEQFYFVWPVVVLMMYRRPRPALWVLGGALLASFALNIALVVDKPTGTFYLPPTRFWELMVGALLAWSAHARHKPAPLLSVQRAGVMSRHRIANATSVAGLLMLLAALAWVDKTDPFPGWWALLPTLGTAALLAAGPNAWVNSAVLSQPVLRFYGHISYPLYLWHWPLLGFPVALGIALDNEVRVAILITSVVLAVLTYELVEKPVRLNTSPRLPWALALALATLGICGWLVWRSDGLLMTYPPQLRAVASTEFTFDYSDYRVDTCMLRLDHPPEAFAAGCGVPRGASGKHVLLWGDSHAASLYPGLSHEIAGQPAPSAYRLSQFTAARCPPLLTAPQGSARYCSQINAFVLAKIKALRPHTVVMAAHWSLYGTDPARLALFADDLQHTISQLEQLGVSDIVVVGHLPTWTIAQPRVLLRKWHESGSVPERSKDGLNPVAQAMDTLVAQATAPTRAGFVSPMALLCDTSGCQVSTFEAGAYQAITTDDSHLSTAGSRLLVRRGRHVLLGEPLHHPVTDAP